MSEQEKNAAVEAEGTVTEAKEEPKKEGWFRRLAHNPKVRKVAKWVGRVLEIGAGIGLGFALGRASSAGNSGTDETPVAPEEAESPSEEDPIEPSAE